MNSKIIPTNDNGNLRILELFSSSSQPVRIEDKRVIFNGNPSDYSDKLYLISAPIGNFSSNLALLWAANKQEALDEACDAGLLDGYLLDEDEIENEDDIIRLGNASEPFDLQDASVARIFEQSWRSDYDFVIAVGRAMECGVATGADL